MATCRTPAAPSLLTFRPLAAPRTIFYRFFVVPRTLRKIRRTPLGVLGVVRPPAKRQLADTKHQIRLRGLVPLTPVGHGGGEKSEKSKEILPGVLSLATFFLNFLVFLASQNEAQKSTKIGLNGSVIGPHPRADIRRGQSYKLSDASGCPPDAI